MRRILIVIFILSGFFSSPAQSEEKGAISGTVLQKDNKEPLPGANIVIEGTLLGTTSDARGFFELGKIPQGQYTLVVRYMGYKVQSVPIRIRALESVGPLTIELEPTTIQTEQIIITGSRQPEKLASAASSINVLSKQDIRRRNNFRIDEALISVPGVAIVGENVNIRGGSGYNRLGGNRTLVLLDDVPILTSDLGSVNWNIIPISEIEHVEVLKGAASALYGSGALSGVINVLTKMPSRGHSFSFRQSVGVYDQPSVPEWKWTDDVLYYHRTDAGYSKSFGPFGLRLASSYHRSTGDRENGEFKRWYFTGKSRWQISDKSTLAVFASYSFEKRGLFLQWLEQNKALSVPPTEKGDSVQLDGFVGYAVYNKLFSPRLSTKIRLSYNQQLVGLPFNITSAFTPALGMSGEWQVNWLPHPDHSLSLGMDIKRDEVESLYYGKRRANGLSPYIQDIWKFSELVQLNTGMRWDTYTLVGDSVETQLSPKIGVSYQPFFGTIFHCSFGRGFRAATVVERFISAGSRDFRALPNPQLQPERSTLFDVGIRQNIGQKAYAELTAFSSTYKNLIEPVLNSDLTAQFVNQPKARIQGIEAEFQWHMFKDWFFLHSSATFMDPKDLENNQTLLYRPKFLAYFSPSLVLGPFRLEADYRYMSRIEQVAIYPLDERVPVKVLDVRFIYGWKKLNFQIAVRNALNYNYTVSERVLGETRNVLFAFYGDL
jgi:outer membrane receptor for ferrienterochelin and colicins